MQIEQSFVLYVFVHLGEKGERISYHNSGAKRIFSENNNSVCLQVLPFFCNKEINYAYFRCFFMLVSYRSGSLLGDTRTLFSSDTCACALRIVSCLGSSLVKELISYAGN